MVIYLDDYQRTFQCPVSILRYEKGDWWQKDFPPVYYGPDAHMRIVG
jgi:hypothetical protein